MIEWDRIAPKLDIIAILVLVDKVHWFWLNREVQLYMGREKCIGH